MNIIINENGDTIKAKDWISIDYNIGELKQSPWGEDYPVIGIDKDTVIANLLQKYDESSSLKFYLFKNIFYITIDEESFHYTIAMNNHEFDNLRNKIINENRVLFVLLNSNEEIDLILAYDKIFK